MLALTVHEDRGYLQQLLQAGASGYLLKRAAADDLIHAIRTVARGGTYLDPSLAGKVLGGLVGRPAAGPAPGDALSDREEEVLRLIARGFTNREIAARLDVSVKTVETHKARAMEKLGLRQPRRHRRLRHPLGLAGGQLDRRSGRPPCRGKP